MSTFAFILGREPHLSIAEIAAVVGSRAVAWDRAVASPHALVAPRRTTTPDTDATQELMRRLGGVTKIGTIWREVPHDAIGDHEAIGQYILEHTAPHQKVCFGFSVYDLGGGRRRVDDVAIALRRGALETKRWLRERDRSVRWVPSTGDPRLSSVVVATNGLLPEENGVEILLLVTPDRLLLGQTLAVQPFADWGSRDYGRPGRDARSGMLPPKLARMMVNLSRVPDGGTILDPFCGSGTVLTEALALGMSRIIGLDVSPVAVADATQNLEWAAERTTHHANVTITHADVRALAATVRERVDAIVTEPYLGAPASRPLSVAEIERRTAELRPLYLAAFAQFSRVLTPGGRIVFVVPVFNPNGAAHTIDITDDVATLGFHRTNPFPEPLRVASFLAGHEDLPYARPDQHVGRRILVFEYRPK